MTFLSIICILIFEQFKALPAERVRSWQSAYAGVLERQFNAGEYSHGTIAWGVGVALPALLVLVLNCTLAYVSPLLAFALGLLLLYLTLGFRQFSHYYSDIQLALRMGEVDRARLLLAEWRGQGGERLGSAEIARLAIEQGLVAAQRHVFAPVFWFVLLGPAGAVLYRLALAMMEHWQAESVVGTPGSAPFGMFARRAFHVLDWLPARLTAITFAIVGDFEDAVYCWRTQAAQWPDAASGILLSSGAGALGIRLGMPLPDVVGIETRPELGLGEDVAIEHLQSAIGLVWRALVLCLLLLALLSVAYWVGG